MSLYKSSFALVLTLFASSVVAITACGASSQPLLISVTAEPTFPVSSPVLLSDDASLTYTYLFAVNSGAVIENCGFADSSICAVTEEYLVRYKKTNPSVGVVSVDRGATMKVYDVIRDTCTVYQNQITQHADTRVGTSAGANYNADKSCALAVTSIYGFPSGTTTSLNGSNRTGSVTVANQDWWIHDSCCTLQLGAAGRRLYYSLTITLTAPSSGSNPTIPTVPAVSVGSMGVGGGSPVSSTLPPQIIGSYFDESGIFKFPVTIPASSSVVVEKSSDLSVWQTLTSVSGGTTTAIQFITDSQSTSTQVQFYRARIGTVYSKTIGFSKLSKPAGKESALWANPFFSGIDNQVSRVIPNVPVGTKIYLGTEAPSSPGWLSAVTYDGLGWSAPSTLLNPGRGFFLQNTNAVTLNLHGYVGEGTLSVDVPSTARVRSSILPRSGAMSQSGLCFSQGENDTISLWDVTSQSYKTWNYVDNAWEGESISAPQVGVGAAFFLNGAARNWLQSYVTGSGTTCP